MSGQGKSRWADSEEDAAREAALKKEKELKKRLKKEKEAARKAEEAARQQKISQDATQTDEADSGRPAKRRRVTPEPAVASSRDEASSSSKLLRLQGDGFWKARSVENYDKLNDIEEGAYGWVTRAKELATGKVVALKRLKIEPNDRNGLPVTGLREIQILKDCAHRNIVKLQEVVVGDDTTKIEKYVKLATIAAASASSVRLLVQVAEHWFQQYLPCPRISRARSKVDTRRHATAIPGL